MKHNLVFCWVSVLLFVASVMNASASEFKPTKMLPAIQTFIATIDEIAQSNLSRQDKTILAKKARQALLSKTRALYGPFENLVGLNKAAKSYIRHFVLQQQKHFEGTGLQTFLRLTAASKRDRSVHNKLMNYGWFLK